MAELNPPASHAFDLKNWLPGQPRIERSVTLQFIGDWGLANFHRICSWLCQEFCDRAGPRSRVGIWNTVEGGIDAARAVFDGEVDMAIITPAHALGAALTGGSIYGAQAMPSLRALAVLPQIDRMVLAVAPEFGIRSFADLRKAKPALIIATSEDNGANLIGYTARRFMEAHGVTEAELESWGGRYINSARPDLALRRFEEGHTDAVLQEAIMAPWWSNAVAARQPIFIPAEAEALRQLETAHGWKSAPVEPGYFDGRHEGFTTLDFSDFVIVVRDDMPDDIAHLLTWCIVEQRMTLEHQFHHIPPKKSPVSYPLVPQNMVKTPLPLHSGAAAYYKSAGIL